MTERELNARVCYNSNSIGVIGVLLVLIIYVFNWLYMTSYSYHFYLIALIIPMIFFGVMLAALIKRCITARYIIRSEIAKKDVESTHG